MKPGNLPALLLLATTSANAALLPDLTNLTASIASVTSTLEEYQNETGPLNTAGMIQSIGWQVGASLANLGCANSSYPTTNASSNTTYLDEIQGAYSNYTSTLTHLATHLSARGSVPHDEPDLPVVQQTQSLTRALYTFGKCLYNGDYITSMQAVDTWNAEGDLQQATSEWEGHDVVRRSVGMGMEGKALRRGRV